jgi:hypothetical protein
MSDYQLAEETNEILSGRALRFFHTGTVSKSGRSLSLVFIDTETGEPISIMAISGALQADVIPMDEELREYAREQLR